MKKSSFCYEGNWNRSQWQQSESLAAMKDNRREDGPRFYITEATPPFLLLHGTKDTQVPVFHSDILYEKLEKEGVPTEFVLIDGVDHADAAFSQTEVKDLILDYLHRTLK